MSELSLRCRSRSPRTWAHRSTQSTKRWRVRLPNRFASCASIAAAVLALLSVTIVVAAGAVAAEQNSDRGQKYTLAYKFQPGEEVRWRVVHQATIRSTIQGSTQTAQTRSESAKVWTIKSVDDDAITFEHSVDWVKMTNQVSGRAKVEYDSTTDEKPPAGFEYAAKAVGVPLTEITMDRHGRVARQVRKVVQPGQNEDQTVAVPLPREPVAVGDTWSEPSEISVRLKTGGSRKIRVRRRFELLGVKTGVATFSVDYQALTPIRDNPALEAQLVQRMYSGQIRFDIDAGRVLSQQLDVDRNILGFAGPTSSMHYLSRMTERPLDEDGEADDDRVARTPNDEKKTQ